MSSIQHYPDESFDSDMTEIFTKNEILSEEARSSTHS
jgi:hypothetical protein